MVIKQFFSALLTALLVAISGLAQTPKPAKEYLQVPGPIRFADNAYHLAWTSHPSATFYKQEYVAAGDRPEHYNTLLLLDVVTGPVSLNEIVRTKIDELRRLKLGNPMVNYEVFKKNGEYLLDFLLSQSSPDGKRIRIVEHNVYRYKTVVTKSKQQAVLMFGISSRGYEGDITRFLTTLKANRPVLLRQVSQASLPQIALAK